jgi:hypothetical protein
MKIVATVARYLLGLMFLVFGLNSFLLFIPTGPIPAGPAGQFATLMLSTHYAQAVGLFQVASAVLFLVNRYIPLALVLLGPVLVNILIFHILMAPSTIPMGLLATILWILVAYRVRSSFDGVLQARSQN